MSLLPTTVMHRNSALCKHVCLATRNKERTSGLAEQDAYHWPCLASQEGLNKGQTQPYTRVTVETLSRLSDSWRSQRVMVLWTVIDKMKESRHTPWPWS